MITTKKGKSGIPRVTFSTYVGVTEKPKLREVTLGTTERRQKLKILQTQLTEPQQQQLPYFLTDSLNPAFNGHTDWQDLFYQSGLIKSADLGITGGGDGGSTYRFSSGYYDEDGIVKATGFTRYSTRLNVISRALKGKLEINPIIAFTRTSRDRGNGSNNFSLGAGNMPSSLYNLSDAARDDLLSTYDKSLDKNLANVFNFNLNLGYSFNEHLKFSSLSSYKYNTSRRNYNRTNDMMGGVGNYSYTYSDQGEDYLTSNYFSYTNEWNKHSFSGVVGQDIQFNVYENTSAEGRNGVADNIQVIQGFLQKNIRASSDYQAYGLLSYYARMSYDYDSRYIFSFAGRWDGSSRFGKGSKWGFFPSASMAWLLSEEKFFKENLSVFNLLKLRGSLGTSGSNNIPNYLQYNLYNVNAGIFDGNTGATSYNGTPAITPNFYNGAAQKNISWEKSKQWNVGIDFELVKGRFSGSIDAYNKESSLQLFSVNLPVTTGYTQALTNAIGVRNAGAELVLAANILPRENAFQWFSRLNFSYNKNTIMNLPNGNRDLVLSGDRFDKSHILSVGSPINPSTESIFEIAMSENNMEGAYNHIGLGFLTGDYIQGNGYTPRFWVPENYINTHYQTPKTGYGEGWVYRASTDWQWLELKVVGTNYYITENGVEIDVTAGVDGGNAGGYAYVYYADIDDYKSELVGGFGPDEGEVRYRNNFTKSGTQGYTFLGLPLFLKQVFSP